MDVRLDTFDEVKSSGCTLMESLSEVYWRIGDLFNYVALVDVRDPLLATRAKTAKALAHAMGLGYRQAKLIANTSRSVPQQDRENYAATSFLHWSEIIRRGYRGEGARRWAGMSQDEGWSVEQLRRELLLADGGETDARTWLHRIASAPKRFTVERVKTAYESFPEDVDSQVREAEKGIAMFREAMGRRCD